MTLMKEANEEINRSLPCVPATCTAASRRVQRDAWHAFRARAANTRRPRAVAWCVPRVARNRLTCGMMDFSEQGMLVPSSLPRRFVFPSAASLAVPCERRPLFPTCPHPASSLRTGDRAQLWRSCRTRASLQLSADLPLDLRLGSHNSAPTHPLPRSRRR